MNRLVIAVTIVSLLTGCARWDTKTRHSTARVRLENAWARWEANAPDSYRMSFRWECFCGLTMPVELDVIGEEVVAGREIATGQPLIATELRQFRSVDGLFERLTDTLDRGPVAFEASYHSALGYPRWANVDEQRNTADDEWGFHIDEFSPAIPEPEPVGSAPASTR